MPRLTGQSVRAVTEECARLGLVPSLVGSGVALEQYPDAGAEVLPGSQVMVRFGRPGTVLSKLAARGPELRLVADRKREDGLRSGNQRQAATKHGFVRGD